MLMNGSVLRATSANKRCSAPSSSGFPSHYKICLLASQAFCAVQIREHLPILKVFQQLEAIYSAGGKRPRLRHHHLGWITAVAANHPLDSRQNARDGRRGDVHTHCYDKRGDHNANGSICNVDCRGARPRRHFRRIGCTGKCNVDRRGCNGEQRPAESVVGSLGPLAPECGTALLASVQSVAVLARVRLSTIAL